MEGNCEMPVKECVIVANGSFPSSSRAYDLLHNSRDVIACDGAIIKLHERNISIQAIVGDLDSVPKNLQQRYASLLHRVEEQETNDLTKAVNYARSAGYEKAIILGATGLREDHTLGNISLLLDYSYIINEIEMISDFGIFTPVREKMTFASWPGQQVSLFTPRPGARLTTAGLRWELADMCPISWWRCTLNEAIGESFSVSVSGDAGAIVYRLF
ncbi:MAG: thiamine diphosphokinase [Tannerellaceae bacterium]|jgi:thiamine pyrophosphokinase|nr:thiamine diphosphokinase [Tannerellaceae bacterium]